MEKIYKIIPRYAFLPMIISLLINFCAYFLSRLFTANLQHKNISTKADAAIPFVKEFMIIYMLAYVVWIVGFIVIGRENRKVCYQIFSAEQIAKIICLMFFVLMPTTMIRPNVIGNGWIDIFCRVVYENDQVISHGKEIADNLFPSLHCLESWVCFRGALKSKKMGNIYKVTMGICALLIFASTLLVKQHVIYDVLGGVLVFEIAMAVEKKINITGMYYLLEKKLLEKRLINNEE